VFHRLWQSFHFQLNRYIAWFITFNFVNFSWIFFRAKHWDDAVKVIHGMLGLNGILIDKGLENFFLKLNSFFFQSRNIICEYSSGKWFIKMDFRYFWVSDIFSKLE